MDSNKRAALLLSLIDKLEEKESWCGETHIQKATYFLQSMTGVDLGLDFILYKHGPFSFDLRDELSAMRATRLLELEPVPPYGPQLRPTAIGRRLLERFPKTLERHRRALETVAEHLGPRNVAELERLATALLASQKHADAEAGARWLNQIKPHIDPRSAKEAIEEVRGWTEDFATA